jgi:4a-hydroxytetrahydrobiopterin dehydratase
MAQTGVPGLMEQQPLAQKHCVACRVGTPCLKGKALLDLQEQLHPGWELMEEQRLEKTYSFKNFQEALDFVNRVGGIAEKEKHHPDVYLSWGKVKLAIWTHKINGLSESDFILAAKCDGVERSV